MESRSSILSFCRICRIDSDDVSIPFRDCGKQVEAVIGIKVNVAPILPSMVCSSCFNRIQDAFHLRELCLESEIRLASLNFEEGYEDYEILEEVVKETSKKEVATQTTSTGGTSEVNRPIVKKKNISVQADDCYCDECECETCELRRHFANNERAGNVDDVKIDIQTMEAPVEPRTTVVKKIRSVPAPVNEHVGISQEEMDKGWLGGSDYKCFKCYRPFTRRNTYLSHMNHIHGLYVATSKSTQNTKAEQPSADDNTSSIDYSSDSSESEDENINDDDVDDSDIFEEMKKETRALEPSVESPPKKKTKQETTTLSTMTNNGNQKRVMPQRQVKYTKESIIKPEAKATSLPKAAETLSRARHCCQCEYSNFDPKLTWQHFMANHLHVRKEKKFESGACRLCWQFFDDPSDLYRHVRGKIRPNGEDNNSESVFACNQCDKQFPALGKLNTHKMIAHAQLNHVCETCGAKFPIRERLVQHISVAHLDQQLVKCKICNKHCRDETGLTKHMEWHKSVDLERMAHNCSYCPKRFGTEAGMHEFDQLSSICF